MKRNTINTIILTGAAVISASLIGFSVVTASQMDTKYSRLQSEYKTMQTEIARNRKENVKVVTETINNLKKINDKLVFILHQRSHGRQVMNIMQHVSLISINLELIRNLYRII